MSAGLSVHAESRGLPWPGERQGEGQGQAPGRGAGPGPRRGLQGAGPAAGWRPGRGGAPATRGLWLSCWVEPETETAGGRHLRQGPQDTLGRAALTRGGAVGSWARGGTGAALVIVPCAREGPAARPGQARMSGATPAAAACPPPGCAPRPRPAPGPLGPSEEPLASAPCPGRRGEAAAGPVPRAQPEAARSLGAGSQPRLDRSSLTRPGLVHPALPTDQGTASPKMCVS